MNCYLTQFQVITKRLLSNRILSTINWSISTINWLIINLKRLTIAALLVYNTPLGLQSSHAMNPKYNVAMKKTQEAVLKTTPVQKTKRRFERFFKRKINPPSWATTAAAVGLVVAREKRVSTRKFKNLKIRSHDWVIRPNIDHYLDNRSTSGSLDFSLSF